MDFDAIADELYGLPLDDFIPARARREKQAKGANDRALAAEIHRLAKPNAVAWLVNQLVRNQPKDIQTLVVLGSEMRKATANLSGDRLPTSPASSIKWYVASLRRQSICRMQLVDGSVPMAPAA